MCLTKPNKIKAERDIVCYKVLKKSLFNKQYYSPLRDFSYYIGVTSFVTYTDKLFIKNSSVCIEGGAFHTFKNFISAKKFAENLNKFHRISFDNDGYDVYDYVIAKCIIPKNCEYIYEGYVNNDEYAPGYASSAIKPIEILNTVYEE